MVSEDCWKVSCKLWFNDRGTERITKQRELRGQRRKVDIEAEEPIRG